MLPLQTHSTDSGVAETASVFAQRIIAALPLMAARQLSMHDHLGQVHWQSEITWGPAEHDAIRHALERFVGQPAPARSAHELPGKKTAVLLRAADAQNVFRGFIMIIVDNRRLNGRGASIQDLPIPVMRAVRDWASALALRSAQDDDPTDTAPILAPLSPKEADRLLTASPAVDATRLDDDFAKLRAFQFSLVAQPLVPLQHGMRIKRFEVLMREAGAPPDAVAPIQVLREANAKGLGAVIDRRAAGALIVWLAGRKELLADQPTLFSLNIAATTLADPNFLRFVELCAGKAGIDPRALGFEIDHGAWLADPASVEQMRLQVVRLGAGLVIDNCLLTEATPQMMSLPGIRLIKLDRSITQDLARNRVNQMRVGALVQISRIAGVHTVAKKVDDPAEQEQLTALGVDFAQGNATAIPVTLSDINHQLETSVILDEDIPEILSAPPAAPT
jgi:EAL domain-containing protein (putative c-di-GMP-specific phosphodiesterase class I)